MALPYLINCLLLTYGPIVVIYKTLLAEHKAMRSFVIGVFAFIITICCKGILLAIVMPESYAENSEDSYDLVGEVFKGFVSMVDIIGLNLALKYKKVGLLGDKHAFQPLTIGLGWVAAELIIHHALYIILNAYGDEFDWVYFQTALTDNIYIVESLCLAYLLHKLMASTNSFLENILTFLMIFTKFVIIPVLFSYIKNTKMANDWQSLGLRAVYGTGFFLFARFICK